MFTNSYKGKCSYFYKKDKCGIKLTAQKQNLIYVKINEVEKFIYYVSRNLLTLRENLGVADRNIFLRSFCVIGYILHLFMTLKGPLHSSGVSLGF